MMKWMNKKGLMPRLRDLASGQDSFTGAPSPVFYEKKFKNNIYKLQQN